MKKGCLILALALVLSLGGCASGWGEPEHESEVAEKPAIYLYPDSEVAEKPAIYLYPDSDSTCDAKPVLYFHPERSMEVRVQLDYRGTLTCTYPEYRDGWTVTARPDGTLTDQDGREYNYLFWEGVSETEYDMTEGFVVAGGDTAGFLEEKLALLGLCDREAGDFITYWLPRMQDNPYNLVTFQQEAYTDHARLTITPEPDSMLRVFMVFQPLEEPVSVPEPPLPGFDRSGFTVVEWGGTELK